MATSGEDAGEEDSSVTTSGGTAAGAFFGAAEAVDFGCGGLGDCLEVDCGDEDEDASGEVAV